MVAKGCTFRLGKGFVFPALQALCALGMLGIRNGTYLAHHLQSFPVVPVFDDPAPRDTVHAHPAHLDPSSGRRDAHELPPMGAACDPPGNHHVPFGDLLLDREVNVGESRVVRAHDLLDVLGSAAQLGVAGSMANVIWSQQLVHRLQLALTEDFLLQTPRDPLVLFRGHIRAPSRSAFSTNHAIPTKGWCHPLPPGASLSFLGTPLFCTGITTAACIPIEGIQREQRSRAPRACTSRESRKAYQTLWKLGQH